MSLFNLPPKQNFKWMSSFKVCLDIVYFAKNWKNCNKIIFKRVNSAVESIFNKSFTEKKRFMGPVNSARDPLKKHNPIWNALLQKKKKKCQNTNASLYRLYPNGYLTFHLNLIIYPRKDFNDLFNFLYLFVFNYK